MGSTLRRGSWAGGDGDGQHRQAGAEDLTCQLPVATQKLRQSKPLPYLMEKVAAIWGLSNHLQAERRPQSGSRKGRGPG